MARLPSHLVVSGLLRAAEAAGGNGAILARGDRDVGALLVVMTRRGVAFGLFERISTIDRDFTWNQSHASRESAFPDSVAQLIDEKKRFDRDIWVVELDVPDVERFIADSLAPT